MNSPKISIIVPVYNVEKYLPYCMDSLLNQTLTDIEIILVDDGSPDNCPAICDEYAKRDDRVKVIHKKNGGLGYARNSGLEIATGEYIAFVDSDDYVETVTYQRLYSIAMDTNADVVYFTFQRFNDQGDVWMETAIREEKRYHAEKEVRGLMLDMIADGLEAKSDVGIQCSSCCALYRHELIMRHELRYKSERELISEDLAFNLDYLLHSFDVIRIPDSFYNYRVNVSSLSRTIKPDKITQGYFFYQYLLEFSKKNNFGTEGYLRATRFFIDHSRNSIRQYVQSQLSLSKKEKLQWLKEVVNYHFWPEIAFSYPYKKLPRKKALHFYLLHKGYCHLLYFLETMYKKAY